MEAIASIVVVPTGPARSPTEPMQRALSAFRDAQLEVLRVHASSTEVRGELGLILETIARMLGGLATEDGVRLETSIKVEPPPVSHEPTEASEVFEDWMEAELLLELEDLFDGDGPRGDTER